jgi:hypothetical protein
MHPRVYVGELSSQPQHRPRLTGNHRQHGGTGDALEEQSRPILQLESAEVRGRRDWERFEGLHEHPFALDRLRCKVGVEEFENLPVTPGKYLRRSSQADAAAQHRRCGLNPGTDSRLVHVSSYRVSTLPTR